MNVFVDFEEVKAQIGLTEALEVLGIAHQFRETNGMLRGVCPFPSHKHNQIRPNANQFTIRKFNGVWMWKCWGDCQAAGTVVTFVERFLELTPAHTRLWFHEHFANRLTATPKGTKRAGESGRASPPKKEARPVQRTPERANSNVTDTKVPDDNGEYKPIRFKLQLQPDVPYLTERAFDETVLRKYGLGLARRGYLKGYVAIPIWDHPRGEFPVGYLGRWPGEDFDADDDRPKYRWPPKFPKQKFLFGLSVAMQETEELPLLVVEGVFDALRCVQNGYPATVAIFGSSLSNEQTELLVATGRNIVLMFDGDEAGRTGLRKAAAMLMPRTFVRAVKLPDGAQPDDLESTALEELLQDCRPQRQLA